MKTGIPEFLPGYKQEELKQIVELIDNTYSRVNMVILYGSYARNKWVEDKYEENGTTFEYISDYDLLIIMSSENHAKKIGVQVDMRMQIEKLGITTPISLIFHGYPYICQMLAEKRYFFCDVYNEGYVLSNKWEREFNKPTEITYEMRAQKADDYFDEWYGSAIEFMEGYEFYFFKGKEMDSLKKYKLASFMLHQATERFFMCILLVFTDYKPKLHDLFKLNKLVCDEDRRFRQVFLETTEEEKRLFKLLKEAYIGSRYDKNFIITKEELKYLAERVEILKKLSEKVCKEKIEYFKKYVD